MFEMFRAEVPTRKPDASYENLGSIHELAALRSYESAQVHAPAPMVGQIALLSVNRTTGEVQLSREALQND